MTEQRFGLVADVSSDDPAAIEPLLRQLAQGQITKTANGFHLEASMTGESARDLNRRLLSALRRVERRTRLPAEWTSAGVTHRFFDYIPKGTRPATDPSAPSE
ncbi:MAG TPA: hypothetical protein VII01_01320 [Solirubrobacteraceae bacterium]|jgi:hypothetical protein